MYILVSLILALSVPLVLLPIEQIFNYPYLIEELVKFFAVYLVIKQSRQTKANYLIFAILVGILFTISESILYIPDFLANGTSLYLPQRIILTSLLHSFTCVLFYIFGKKNNLFLLLALIAAILLHYYYNLSVTG